MAAREKLTPNEKIAAYTIGGGITLGMLALLFKAFGNVDDSATTSVLVIGLAFIALGVGFWLYVVKPWTHFDDLQTPHYTGGHGAAQPEAAVEIPPYETAADIRLGGAIPAGREQAAPVQPPAYVPPPVEYEVETAPAVPATEAHTPDDLTLIEGIGDKTAQALAAAGITTFAQVADSTPEDLIAAAQAHGARASKADTWPAQAKRIMFGDLSAVSDAQKRIVRGEQHDDLTQIEGIGPKSQSVLYAAGITTFAQLAKADPEQLRGILQDAKLNPKLLAPETWPEQSILIMNGDLSGLKALQEQLKRGRHGGD